MTKTSILTPSSQSLDNVLSKDGKPLIVFIAESDHADLSYPQIAEEIIKSYESQGLKTILLTEFGNKERNIGSEQEKKLVGYFSENQINKFIDERSDSIGNVFDRFNKLIPNFLQIVENEDSQKTPVEIFEKYKDRIDNPETKKILEEEANLLLANGIMSGIEFATKNANAFVQKETHESMASDAVNKIRSENCDLVVVMAGSPHIYGISEEMKKLDSQYEEASKIIVGKFEEYDKSLATINSIEVAKKNTGKESCEMVAKTYQIEMNEIPHEVLVIITKIAEESKEKIEGIRKGQENSGDGSPSPSPRALEVASQVTPPLNVHAKTTT
jgi:hypothetical protein